ncbi:MAG: hypothetical protein M3R38_33080 [Actinomycetota bacterium]|nr:hypothetical protein [Actinomycetota bacterium]
MQTDPQRGTRRGRGLRTKPEGEGGGSGLKWLWAALGIIALIVLAIILWQLFNEEESAGPEQGVTISDITDNPEEFYGSTATVSGQVAEVVDPEYAFSMGGEDDLGGGTLLVVGAGPLPEIVAGEEQIGPEDAVQATGDVRPFNLVEFEEDIGADLDDAAFSEFEGQPAILANQLDMTPDAADAGEPAGAVQATLSDITDNPEEFYGQTLTVDGGAVAEVLNPDSFVIIDAETAAEEIPEDLTEEGVLVIGSTDGPLPELGVETPVQVTGLFREFNLVEVEEELGTELDDAVYEDWEGRPAILADQVQPV